jgi:dipeptidase E
MIKRNIIAIGGGGFGRNPNKPIIEEYILNLSDKKKPTVTFFPTASAENSAYIVNFYTAFGKLNCKAQHISLFKKTPDLKSIIAESDIIYIGGGNTKSMLAVFREWNLDTLIINAYKEGKVLAGVSAGAICWFEKGITDSWAGGLKILDCMGILKGTCCPHYDGEANRKPSVKNFLKNKEIENCLCIEDGAAAHYENEILKTSISFYKDKNTYQVSYKKNELIEEPLDKININ